MLLGGHDIQVDQALIIDEPWVSKIIAGEKIWEMRTTPNSKTGWMGLIRKGSGLIVGLMEINGSQGPFTKEQLHIHFDKHKVGPELINNENYKWFHAWKITKVMQFDTPIRYNHPNGAVIWVNLDEDTKVAIQKQTGGQLAGAAVPDEKSSVDELVDAELRKLFGKAMSDTSGLFKDSAEKFRQNTSQKKFIKPDDKQVQKSTSQFVEAKAAPKSLVSTLAAGKSVSVVLTQGNINNNHFYLPQEDEFFAAAMWGGNNKLSQGTKGVFHFQGIELPVETDIDGSKRILRSRGAIGAFFKLHELGAGDEIVISRNSDFSFGVGFKKIAGVK